MIPIEVDGNFTADASGNGTDKRIIQSGHWCAVYASCQCAGSGQWVAGKLGRAQFFQQGANVVLGPIILQPGQQAQVTVAGATPGAAASIVYWGWQSDAEDGADLAATVPSLETAGSLSGTVPIPLSGNVGVFNAPGTNLGTRQDQTLLVNGVTLPAGGGSLGTLSLPAGSHAVAIAATLQPTNISIIGGTTGLQWAVVAQLVSGSAPIYVYKVLSSIDPTITVQIATTVSSGVVKVWAAAILDTMLETLDMQQAGSVQLAGIPNGSGGSIVTPIGSENTSGLFAALAVSHQRASAAPWQAPSTDAYQETNSNGVLTLVAGVGGQTIRVFGYSVTAESTTAATIVAFLQDSSRASPANRIVPFAAAGNGITTASGNRGGDPLPLGAGLQLNFAAGGGFVRASVAYSQV